MRDLYLNEFMTTWRMRLVNFNDRLAERFPDKAEGAAGVELDVIFFRDEGDLISGKLRKGPLGGRILKFYGSSYLVLAGPAPGRVSCFFERGVSFAHILREGVNAAFLAFRDMVDVIFLHSSSVIVGDKAYLFVAPPEGGKSTIFSYARERGIPGIDDECCVIKKHKDRYFASSYPFDLLSGRGNAGKEIEKIFFLEKAEVNRAEGLSKTQAMKRALPETEGFFTRSVPPEGLTRQRRHAFDFVGGMLDKVDHKLLYFRKDPGAVSCALQI